MKNSRAMDTTIPVSEIMTSPVITLHEDDTLRLVDKTFEKHSFHHIPILNSQGKIVGIISKEDILRLISVRNEFTDKEFGRIKVRDFMSTNVVKISPDDSVGLAAVIIMANKFHALPVVDDQNRVVGIVTSHDLIRYAYQDSV